MKKNLFFLIIYALLPLVAFADSNGICGPLAKWTYIESTHTLIISGSGEMKDYNHGKITPGWNNFKSKIETVEVEEGITHIGDYSFENCSNLESLSIPSTVISMGVGTLDGTKWYDCQEDGVVYAGKMVYRYKGTMPENTCIEIEEGTLGIADLAFYDCKGLASIIMPNSVVHIGSYAFYGTSWDKNLPQGLIYIGKVLYKYNGTMPENTCIEIEEGTLGIADLAFYDCKGLTSIIMPNSVNNIGANAFGGCIELETITISEKVSSIANATFSNCSSLKTIIIPEGVKTIGLSAFWGSGLTSVSIPDDVCFIDGNAFGGCISLSTASLGKKMRFIESGAFGSCPNLISLEMYCDTISFNSGAFNNNNIKKITFFGKKVPSYDFCYFFQELENVILSENVESISDKAFKDCTKLKTAKFSVRLKEIGNYAFSGCTNLESVAFPDSLNTIGNYAFQYCRNVTNWTLNKGLVHVGDAAFYNCGQSSFFIPSTLQEIGGGALGGPNLTEVVFEESEKPLICESNPINIYNGPTIVPVEKIYLGRTLISKNPNVLFTHYFNSLTQLSSITIGAKVTQFNPDDLINCSGLKSIVFEDGEEDLLIGNIMRTGSSISNCPINNLYIGRNFTGMINPFAFKSPFTVTFGNNITSVSGLSGCTGLSSVTIPDNVKIIGNGAFSNTSLTEIVIPNSVKSIGNNAFSKTNLKEIVIPDSVTSIGESAFENCTEITSLIIPRSVKTIDCWAFRNCTQLQKIILENGSDPIDFRGTTGHNDSFVNCPLKDVFVGRHVKYNSIHPAHRSPFLIGTIKQIVFDIDLSSDDGKVYRHNSIDTVVITNKVSRIETYAFHEWSGLKVFVVEDGADDLYFGGGENFKGCPLDSVYIGRNMTYSWDSPFKYNKEWLKHITFGGNVTIIPEKLFSNFKNLSTLTLPKFLLEIGRMAFYGCEGLTSLTIPGNVTEIGMQAFDLCRNLKSLIFEDGVEKLMFTAPENNLNNAFQNSPIEEVYLGRNISFMYSSPLSIFESLKTLTFGREVTHVADKAFIGCPNLKNVISYANTVPTTGEVVFTPSYLPAATLHVPYELYDQYKVAPTWKKFGSIKNFEGLYNLTYFIDGEVYKDSVIEQNSPIASEAEPEKEGYTFSGWSEIPRTMPAKDVVVTGSFTVNSYTVTFMYGNEVLHTEKVNYGAPIPLPNISDKYGFVYKWLDVPETMPAHDVVLQVDETDVIFGIADENLTKEYYLPNGQRVARPQKGLNIIRMSNGTSRRMLVR